MAIITTNDQNYQNIAKTIRMYSGEEVTYTPAEMPKGIEKVLDRGYAEGLKNGYGEGHTSGFIDGEQSYRQYFWDQYQAEGARTDYSYAFAGAGWTEETFWPAYNITVQQGYQMFAYCAFSGSLKERLEACKVQLQFSGNQTLMNLFCFADKITELGVIDFSAVTNTGNTHIFRQCSALKTIEKLILPVGQASWTSWFSGCSALENIQIQGIIVSSGLDLSASPKLTRESMLSVMNALADKTGLSGTWKVTFGATNLEKLTDADKAIATQKGWTLV